MEDFLKFKAVDYDKRDKGRTYLFLDADGFTDRRFEIAGYFTLAIHSMPIPKGSSKTLVKKLLGGAATAEAIPVYLIGQLAKNDLFAEKISGKMLLDKALSYIRAAQEIAAGRVVAVDCKPEPKLHEFYLRSGFKFLGHNVENNLDQFVLKMN